MGTHKKISGATYTWTRREGGKTAGKEEEELHIFKFCLRAEQKKNFHLFSSAICGKICARRKNFLAKFVFILNRNSASCLNASFWIQFSLSLIMKISFSFTCIAQVWRRKSSCFSLCRLFRVSELGSFRGCVFSFVIKKQRNTHTPRKAPNN